MKTLVALASVAAIALVASAVALAGDSGSKRHAHAATVKVSTRSVAGLGQILVDSKGRTLYMFVPDKRKKVTCHAVCAKIWPPLFVHGKTVAAGAVKKALLGSDPDSTGGRVVTYNHWPLYLYLGDRKPGDVSGQAVNMNGGLWYVLSASGAVIKHKPSAGGGGGSTGGSGSGSGSGGTSTNPSTTPGQTGPALCSDDDGDGDESAGGPDDGDGCI